MEIMERVRQRRSVRTFEQRAVDQGSREKLRQLLRECAAGPFGTPLRLELLELDPVNPRELKNLGTYGTIRGAGLYLIGAVKDIAGSQVDLGYCLEKVVLEATALGLGSCWLGGTFRRSRFARRIELADDELLPVVIPLGCPAESEKLWDRLIRSGSRSSRRKPWCELFFTEDGRTPLSEKDAGSYRNALEAVRLAPSALNRQPWRIIRDQEGRYRLYLKEERLFNRALGKIRLQHVDIGIAMSHFELAAREQALPGRWDPHAGAVPLAGLEHMALWDSSR